MLTLIKDGGAPMFPVLVFGFVTLLTAAYFAWRPADRHQGFIEWMCRATAWATVGGIVSCLAATFYNTSSIEDGNLRARIITEGLAESMSPGIIGFALLALAAMLTAVGRRRLDAKQR